MKDQESNLVREEDDAPRIRAAFWEYYRHTRLDVSRLGRELSFIKEWEAIPDLHAERSFVSHLRHPFRLDEVKQVEHVQGYRF